MNESVKSILEMCKDGTITVDEALNLIEALDDGIPEAAAIGSKHRDCDSDTNKVPWLDDGKLRIVAYIGNKLIKKNDSAPEFKVDLEDYSSMDVECWGSLECGDVEGNATAGSHIECGDVNGKAFAGSHIQCGDISGSVTAGSSVNAGDIAGSATAGGNLNAGDIDGNVSAGGNISCGDVGGDVRCNSMSNKG